MAEQLQQTQALLLAIASLKKDMEALREEVKKEVPVLMVNEAIDGFTAYLEENAKPNTRRSLNYILSMFEKAFEGRNMATIAPIELQEFLAKNWGHCKVTVLKQSLSRLRWLFSWSIKYCRVLGRPGFHNPCDLIDTKSPPPPDRPDFVPIHKMVEFLSSAKSEKHWLVFAILMTAGLRASELIGDKSAEKPGLCKKDINGRLLSIRNPKSGRAMELAVIPGWVADRLSTYAATFGPEEAVLSMCYSTLYGIVDSHARGAGLKFSPHYLRKWIASYWDQLGEPRCSDFVLRHNGGLRERYVALPPEEMMRKQDEMLTDKILAKEVLG